MTSLTKKILTVFSAGLLAVCLALGLFFALPKTSVTAFAEGEQQQSDTVTLSDAKYFDVSGSGVLTGLKDYAEDVGTKKIALEIPSTVKEIGEADATGSLFSAIDNKLVSVKIPASVEKINSSAFRLCEKLATVEFAADAKLTTIGVSAFQRCNALTEITIPNSVTEICNQAFYYSSALNKVTFGTGLETVGDTAFSNCSALNTVIEFKEGLTKIGQSAFSGCPSILGIRLPNSLEEIGANAFKGLTTITQITIPTKVETIGAQAFDGCTSVTNIQFNAMNCKSNAANMLSPFSNGASGVKVVFGADGAQVKQLPSYLFRNTKISEVEFANVNLLEGFIGSNVFEGCSELTKVSYAAGSNVIAIRDNTFSGCSSLYDITLPSSVTSIDSQAFFNCPSLFSINIPANVTAATIGTNAFGGTTQLLEVHNQSAMSETAIKDSISTVKSVYGSTGTSNVKYVNDQGVEDANGKFVFLNADGDTYLIKYIGEGGSVTLPNYKSGNYKIYNRAFMNNTSVTEVIIPSGVTEIGNEAFSGCTALTKVVIPATVKEDSSNNGIGQAAFQNCTSLETVELNADITSIKANTFAGCAKLKNITVPAAVNSIGSSAFNGCTALGRVTFLSETLRTIEQDAFRSCASLKVFESPANLMGIGDSAFAGCTSLKTFYLPTQLTSYSFPNDSELLLIAEDSTYEYYSKTLTTNCKLTYEVEISLKYGDNTDKVLKLFGLDYKYVKNSDESWILSDNGMPVQDGYSESVWYKVDVSSAEPQEADKVNEVQLNNLLKDANWLKDAKLYAYVLTVPELEVNDLRYNEGLEFEIDKIFTGKDINFNSFEIEVLSYTDNSGKASEHAAISDAGDYKVFLKIKDSNKYGQWAAGNATFDVTVDRAPLSLNNDNDLWQRLDGNRAVDLDPQKDKNDDDIVATLYIYGNNPYTTIKEGQTPTRTVEVTASYTVRTGKAITLVYGANDENKKYEILGYEGETTETNAGIYSATVIIQLDNNHMLQTVSDAAIKRGISIIQSGNTYKITKTWYIVNTDGGILVSSSGAFEISSDLTYGKDNNFPEAPDYVGADKDAKYSVKFTLAYLDEEINSDGASSEDYTRITELEVDLNDDNFEYYVNSSMPAGNYLITFYVYEYDTNNTQVLFETFDYEFTVQKAQLSSLLSHFAEGTSLRGNLGVGGSLTCEVKNDGKLHLDDGKVNVPITTLTETQVHNRHGYWAQAINNSRYTKVEVSYRLVKGAVDGMYYYTASQLQTLTDDGSINVIPNSAGQYRVYYNITAPNYEPFVDIYSDNERTNYYYTLIIYEEIGLPTVARAEYTGSQIVFSISSPYYTAVLLDGKTDASNTAKTALGISTNYNYTDAGEHVIALMMNNTDKVYRWANTVTYQDGRYARLHVMIDKATNSSTQPLYVKGWQWDNYDADNNKPNWGTKFNEVTDGLTYTFTLINQDTGDEYVYGNTEEDEKPDFKFADAGNYRLLATCSGNNNIKEFSTEIVVEILKADITWAEIPHINSWRYGDYEKIFKEPKGVINSAYNDALDEIDVYYCLQSEINNANRTKHASLKELLDGNGEVPSGNYVLVYELASSTNFNEWTYPVYFSVLKAENYWDVTPVVQGWRYGEFAERGKDPVATPHFKGVVTYQYERLDENGAPISTKYATLADMVAAVGGGASELPVGNYRLTVAVTGTVDYEPMKLTEVTFSVAKTDNSWIEIPTIIGWSEGNYKADDNYPNAQSAFGTVIFSIKDADGNEYDIGKIKTLGVGAYTLIARVNGTENYNELTATATFAVFEDSVGMTGLAVATLVFSVIAIGLAVCGAVLLIRRNKKIEQEFRTMIKSELNRR